MKKNLPIKPTSHKKAKLSQLEFEALLNDWNVFSFKEVEYGIDSLVQITRPLLNSEDSEVTNHWLSVQLKSTEKLSHKKNGLIPFSGVPVEKINLWCGGNIPTLFVVYDFSKSVFFYQWIDAEFTTALDKARPGWRTQASTTIDIPVTNVLSKKAMLELSEYVFNYKRSTKRNIPAGTFFGLQEEIGSLLLTLNEINGSYPFDSTTKHLSTVTDQLRTSTYRVTVTGQTKAGKSSVINALLHRYISTVDFLPVTEIPINFIAGKEEYSDIVYQDGRREKGLVNEGFLRKFISKDENKGNKRGVEMVNVFIKNHKLENGVLISDVPGIDDLEERVQGYTWSTLSQSNAILYVVDAFPFEGGGQVFNYAILQDLKRLKKASGIDRVFILFNKVDRIKSHPLSALQRYIDDTFEMHGITEIVHSKIFYVSAEKSFDLRMGKLKRGKDTIAPVEDELWTYMLNENKIGAYKLKKVMSEMDIVTRNYLDLADVTLSKDKNFKAIQKQITKARESFPSLETTLMSHRNRLGNEIRSFVDRRHDQVLNKLDAYLEDAVLGRCDFPTLKWIKNFLINNAYDTIRASNDYLSREFMTLRNSTDQWVEEMLDKVRDQISGSHSDYKTDLSGLNNFVVRNLEDFNVALGLLNFGLIGLLAIEFPPLALFVGILSLLGWVASADQRKRSKKDKIMEQCRSEYFKTSVKMKREYERTIGKNVSTLINYGADRLNIFLDDLRKKITDLKANPISEVHRALLEGNKTEIEDLRTNLRSVQQKLDDEFF